MIKRLYTLLGIVCLTGTAAFASGASTILLEANIALVDGKPLEGEHRVVARLYSDETQQDWEEVHKSVDFTSGLAAIELGSLETLDPDMLDIATPNLVLVIEGEEITIPLYSSFFTMKAQSANHVKWSNIEGKETPSLSTLRFSLNDLGETPESASIAVNWQTASKQKVRLTDDTTLSFTAPDGTGHVMLIVKQDATGGHTVTWPAAVKWPGGIAPTLTSAANAIDVFTLYYDGEVYLGNASFDFR
jgi:hypothetical protein